MPQHVQVNHSGLGTVQFPDGMTPDMMVSHIVKHIAKGAPAHQPTNKVATAVELQGRVPQPKPGWENLKGSLADAGDLVGEGIHAVIGYPEKVLSGKWEDQQTPFGSFQYPTGSLDAATLLFPFASKALKSEKMAEPFYSALAKAVEQKMPNVAPIAQVKSILGSQGVRKDEVAWTGIEHWLEDLVKSGKNTVSKADVRGFIDAHNVQLHEIMKGENVKLRAYAAEAQQRAGRAETAKNNWYYNMKRQYGGYHDQWPENVRAEYDAKLHDLSQLLDQAREAIDLTEHPERIARRLQDAGEQLNNIHTNLIRFAREGDTPLSTLDAMNLPTKLVDGRVTVDQLPPELQTMAKNYLAADKHYRDTNALHELTHFDSPTKFSSPKLSLPGGENYKEMLLTLPDNAADPASVKLVAKQEPGNGHYVVSTDKGKFVTDVYPNEAASPEAAVTEARRRMINEPWRTDAKALQGDNYKSSHWSEPNILAHVRFNERTINGKKTLFIEEIQSDWHQAARHLREAEVKRLAEEKGIPLAGPNQPQQQAERELRKSVPTDFGYKSEPLTELPPGFQVIDRGADRFAGWNYKEHPSGNGSYDVIKNGEVIGNVPNERAASQYIDRQGKDFPSGDRFVVRSANDNPIGSSNTREQAIQNALGRLNQANTNAVPNAPMKQSWHELAMKRILRHAADNGFDQVAWTSGKQQAERYNLAKHISEITFSPNANYFEGGNLTTRDHAGKIVLDENDITWDKLPEYIGEEATEKLKKAQQAPEHRILGKDEHNELLKQKFNGMNPLERYDNPFRIVTADNELVSSHATAEEAAEEAEYYNSMRPHTLSGLDLNVGGEGMKGFYDEILPNFANKYGKKWGSMVESLGVDTTDQELDKLFRLNYSDRRGGNVLVPNDKTQFPDFASPVFTSGEEAYEWLRQQGYGKQTVHGLPVTPAMKQSVMEEGQPLYVGAPPVQLAPIKKQEPSKPTNALGGVPLRSLMRRVTNMQSVAPSQ